MRATLVALLLAGCGAVSTDRCQKVKAELDACVGSTVPDLDCSTLSDADLDRVHDLTQGLSCKLLAGALPLDGDYVSATCRLLDLGCVAPLTPALASMRTRYPVLLVNGIDTSPLFRYSERILSALASQPVYLATLPPYQPSRKRAPLLWARMQAVMAATGAPRVNLICHSLGGLDCRYVASPAGLAADVGDESIFAAVASVTTIGTAHEGTPVADALLGFVPSTERGQLVRDFATLVGDWFTPSVLTEDADVIGALGALSVTQAPAFNAEIVDAPDVYYQSFAGFSSARGDASAERDARVTTACAADGDAITGPLLPLRHDWLALPLAPFAPYLAGDGNEPSDGLIPVSSTRWGHFRGCVPADHMEQLGQRDLPDTNVRTGFDVARFYANLADDLATRGF